MSDERTGRNGVKRRLTIRMRLTLSYSGLITGSGAALITLVYLYMRFVPNYQIVPNDGIPSAEDGAFGPAQTTDGIAINSADDFLENLLVASAIALIVLALLGGLAGWSPGASLNPSARSDLQRVGLPRGRSTTASGSMDPTTRSKTSPTLSTRCSRHSNVPSPPNAASQRTHPTNYSHHWQRSRR